MRVLWVMALLVGCGSAEQPGPDDPGDRVTHPDGHHVNSPQLPPEPVPDSIGPQRLGVLPGPAPFTLPAPPDDPEAKCQTLEAVWNGVPDEHRACGVDADCALIVTAGSCMNVALHHQAEPTYRAYLEAHGVPCIYHRMGQCNPPVDRGVACREGLCTVTPALGP